MAQVKHCFFIMVIKNLIVQYVFQFCLSKDDLLHIAAYRPQTYSKSLCLDLLSPPLPKARFTHVKQRQEQDYKKKDIFPFSCSACACKRHDFTCVNRGYCACSCACFTCVNQAFLFPPSHPQQEGIAAGSIVTFSFLVVAFNLTT